MFRRKLEKGCLEKGGGSSKEKGRKTRRGLGSRVMDEDWIVGIWTDIQKVRSDMMIGHSKSSHG